MTVYIRLFYEQDPLRNFDSRCLPCRLTVESKILMRPHISISDSPLRPLYPGERFLHRDREKRLVYIHLNTFIRVLHYGNTLRRLCIYEQKKTLYI